MTPEISQKVAAWAAEANPAVRFRNDKFFYPHQSGRSDKLPEIMQDCMTSIREFLDIKEFRSMMINILKPDPQNGTVHSRTDEDLYLMLCEAMGRENINVSPDGISVKKDEFEMDEILARAAFARQTRHINQELEKDCKIAATRLYDDFKLYVHDLKTEYVKNLRLRLRYQHALGLKRDRIIGTVIDALRTKGEREQHMLMMMQWLWLVKRRVFMLPTMWEHMWVLHSPDQGHGKTSFLQNHLCSPLENRYTSSHIDHVCDVREINRWSGSYVVNFDEMQKGAPTHFRKSEDLNAGIKRLVTEVSRQERIFGTQELRRFDMRCTLAGTTNRSLPTMICDPTGMRRYWQTEVSAFDWTMLDNIKANDGWWHVWQCIDENDPNGYYDPQKRPDIVQVQNTYCVQPYMRDWFADHYTLPEYVGHYASDYTDHRAFTKHDLYTRYKDACEDAKLWAVGIQNFELMLGKIGAKALPSSQKRAKLLYVLTERQHNQPPTGEAKHGKSNI